MAPGIILLALIGVWLIVQTTAGGLPGRLLSWRASSSRSSGSFWDQLDVVPSSPSAGSFWDQLDIAGVGSAGGRTADGVPLTTWQGATLATSVMPSFQRMVRAAAADGVTLQAGSTYRDRAQQIELRKAHCGTSHHAIYEMSANACSPPTARPGTSRHERGEAIDFQNMTSRGGAGFQWLADNAARFGWFNLPSEPWHWSRDGH